MKDFFFNPWTIGIGGSLIAAAIGAVALHFKRILCEKIRAFLIKSKKKKFMFFFGINKSTDTRKALITIPIFQIDIEKNDADESGEKNDINESEIFCHNDKSRPAKWEKGEKDIATACKTSIASRDLMSALSISELLNSYNINHDIVLDNKWPNKICEVGKLSLFSIGLFSNNLSCKLYHATHDNPFISISPMKCATSGGEIRIKTEGNDVRNWVPVYKNVSLYEKAETGKPIYAVIMKIIDKNNGQVGFMTGGLNDYGTEMAGKYLKEHWEEIYELQAQDQKKIGCRSFVLLLRQVKGKNTIGIETCYACEENASFTI